MTTDQDIITHKNIESARRINRKAAAMFERYNMPLEAIAAANLLACHDLANEFLGDPSRAIDWMHEQINMMEDVLNKELRNETH